MPFIRAVHALGVAALMFSTSAMSHAAYAADDSHAQRKARLEHDANLRFDSAGILVKFKSDTTAERHETALVMVGGSVGKKFKMVPGLEQLDVKMPVEAALTALRASDLVEYAEPDYVVHHAGTPN